MNLSDPGYYDWYPSAMCSPWYVWFVELGYPLLDIRKFEDAEWAILQYHAKPYLPSTTMFHWVLQGLRNIEITPGFVSKWVELLDLTKRGIWEREDAKSDEVEREHEALKRHSDDMVTRAHAVIMKNENLLGRIAKFGIGEMDLAKIAAHIPSYRW